MRAPFVAISVAAAAFATGAGCTVGSGAGSAVGPMFIFDCNGAADDNQNVGTPEAPACVNLAPKFFAGEPIEDPSSMVRSNQLIIRLQRSGNRVEITDTVSFFIENSFEVARCLRGERNPDGTPNWDTRQVVNIKGQCTGVPWCDWSSRDGAAASLAESACMASMAGPPIPQGADTLPGTPGGAPAPPGCVAQMRTAPPGPPRPLIHFGPQEYIRGSLLPLFTCNDPRLTVATVAATAIDGWIDFLAFGGAIGPPILDSSFKVNFGEQLEANYHMVLQDNHFLQELRTDGMVPAPRIGGTVDGYFDFDLERGRAAQPFP